VVFLLRDSVTVLTVGGQEKGQRAGAGAEQGRGKSVIGWCLIELLGDDVLV
jgi:hypothetical protein